MSGWYLSMLVCWTTFIKEQERKNVSSRSNGLTKKVFDHLVIQYMCAQFYNKFFFISICLNLGSHLGKLVIMFCLSSTTIFYNIQLSPEGVVHIYRDAKHQGIYIHRSSPTLRGIVVLLFLYSEYPRIFRVTRAKQNTRKLLSTNLLNTNNYYILALPQNIVPQIEFIYVSPPFRINVLFLPSLDCYKFDSHNSIPRCTIFVSPPRDTPEEYRDLL